MHQERYSRRKYLWPLDLWLHCFEFVLAVAEMDIRNLYRNKFPDNPILCARNQIHARGWPS